MISMEFVVAALGAYLVGSFPTALVVGKMRNIDITKQGSGNIGGTNAMRVMGFVPGLTVMIVDILKAALPTYLAAHVMDFPLWQSAIVALATVVGHNWSIYIGFRGGKGIACTIGAGAVLYPIVLMLGFLVFLTTIAITRYVSVGSIVMMVFLPVVLWVYNYPREYVLLALLLFLIGTYRHRANIRRLLEGTENQIGKKRTT